MAHENPVRRQWWRKFKHGAAPVVTSPAARTVVTPVPPQAMVQVEARSGKIKLSMYSSVRKLRRAMNRGHVPDDRQVIIDTAVATAARRAHVYRNAHARRAAH